MDSDCRYTGSLATNVFVSSQVIATTVPYRKKDYNPLITLDFIYNYTSFLDESSARIAAEKNLTIETQTTDCEGEDR